MDELILIHCSTVKNINLMNLYLYIVQQWIISYWWIFIYSLFSTDLFNPMLTLDILNFELYLISKVYTSRVKRYRDTKFWVFGKDLISFMKKMLKKLSLCHKLKFSIPTSLQHDGGNLWYFKLRLFDLTELISKVFKI